MEAYYTVREAAELLHVSLRTAQRYVQEGKLKATTTAAGTRRISTRALLEFLGETDAPAEAFNPDTLAIAQAYVTAAEK